MKIDIPRDRKSEFEPQIVKKYQNTVTRDMEKNLFFVKHFSLKKALKFPVFIKGFSLLSADIEQASLPPSRHGRVSEKSTKLESILEIILVAHASNPYGLSL